MSFDNNNFDNSNIDNSQSRNRNWDNDPNSFSNTGAGNRSAPGAGGQ